MPEYDELARIVNTALDMIDDDADFDAARDEEADYPVSEHETAVKALRDLRDRLCRNAAARAIDMDAVVRELHRLGHHAYVEQTGGGCATIFAGPIHVDDSGNERYAAAAGPGWFDGPGWTNARAHAEEFCIGRDDDGESASTYVVDHEDISPAALAQIIISVISSTED